MVNMQVMRLFEIDGLVSDISGAAVETSPDLTGVLRRTQHIFGFTTAISSIATGKPTTSRKFPEDLPT